MLEDGTVTHYDITKDNLILHNIPVEELEILISEKHEHFDNYDKNAEVLGENRFVLLAPLVVTRMTPRNNLILLRMDSQVSVI